MEQLYNKIDIKVDQSQQVLILHKILLLIEAYLQKEEQLSKRHFNKQIKFNNLVNNFILYQWILIKLQIKSKDKHI